MNNTATTKQQTGKPIRFGYSTFIVTLIVVWGLWGLGLKFYLQSTSLSHLLKNPYVSF